MNRKSQITVFIIIGILILLGTAFLLYFRTIIFPGTEIVSEDIMPVKNYIDSCLSKVSEDAIVKLGIQGGYIKIPDEMKLSESYIEFLPNSNILIPYWNSNGISYVPSIETMQQQISDYIQENIQDCINLEIFQNDYEIEQSNDTIITTVIAQEDVDITMAHQMTVRSTSTDEQSKISKFTVTVPARLRKVYDLAKQIMDAENSKTYFENMTIDWMSMNPKIPLNGIEFHCSDLKWRVEDVKKELQQTIYYNLPKVSIKNTNHPGFIEKDSVYEDLKKYKLQDISEGNYPAIETPEDAYDYSHYLLDVRASKTDLKAGFFYNPVWGIELTARPSENGIMNSVKQDASQEFLSFMCLNVYHFTYDAVYPIEVMVRDDKSFNSKGYIFRFAFPVMINHNAPDRKGFLNKDIIIGGSDYVGACDQLTGQEYDIRAIGLDDFGITGMSLKDVNITYDCFKFRCQLGMTKADEGSYRLVTKLPSSCAHGFIIAEKEGYLKGQEQVLDNQDIDVQLRKTKSFDFEVVMDDYNSINNKIEGSQLVKSPFTAIISLQSYDDPSLSFYGKYPFDENTADKKIRLIEQNSRYKLDITLFDEVDGIIIGGYKGNWTLRYDDLASNNRIIFHAISYLPKPMDNSAEQKVIEFIDENNIYINRLEPELS